MSYRFHMNGFAQLFPVNRLPDEPLEKTRARFWFWLVLYLAATFTFAYNLLSGGNLLLTTFSGLAVLSLVSNAWLSLKPLLRPRRCRLDPKRVAVLSNEELDVLETILSLTENDGEYSEDSSNRNVSAEELGLISIEAAADTAKALIRAGLLEDRRCRQGESRLTFAPTEEAQAALESERSRRERTIPVGPRQRPSALSA